MAIVFIMAIPMIKATYSFDAETVRLLEQVSRRWGVSKSEALRRAVRAAAAHAGQEDDPVGLLRQLQAAAALSKQAASSWAGSIRAERRAARSTSARPK